MNLKQYLQRIRCIPEPGKRRGFALFAAAALGAVVHAQAWGEEFTDVVYVESNSVAGNAILAFRNDGSGK
jgi:hypothetical protein